MTIPPLLAPPIFVVSNQSSLLCDDRNIEPPSPPKPRNSSRDRVNNNIPIRPSGIYRNKRVSIPPSGVEKEEEKEDLSEYNSDEEEDILNLELASDHPSEIIEYIPLEQEQEGEERSKNNNKIRNRGNTKKHGDAYWPLNDFLCEDDEEEPGAAIFEPGLSVCCDRIWEQEMDVVLVDEYLLEPAKPLNLFPRKRSSSSSRERDKKEKERSKSFSVGDTIGYNNNKDDILFNDISNLKNVRTSSNSYTAGGRTKSFSNLFLPQDLLYNSEEIVINNNSSLVSGNKKDRLKLCDFCWRSNGIYNDLRTQQRFCSRACSVRLSKDRDPYGMENGGYSGRDHHINEFKKWCTGYE